MRSSPRKRNDESALEAFVCREMRRHLRGRARRSHRRKSGEKIFGTIDTREKFLDKRLELAQHEWARMKANDSLECRNCHGYDYMDFTRQSPRAAFMHSTYLATNEKTCIDCHKGIAHRLPDVTLTTDTSPQQEPPTHPAVAAGEASGPYAAAMSQSPSSPRGPVPTP